MLAEHVHVVDHLDCADIVLDCNQSQSLFIRNSNIFCRVQTISSLISWQGLMQQVLLECKELLLLVCILTQHGHVDSKYTKYTSHRSASAETADMID